MRQDILGKASLLRVFSLVLLILSLVVVFVAQLSFAEDYIPPKKTVTPGVQRIYGNDRIGTSIEIAKKLKKELNKTAFDSIIVTRSDKWQDALAGSYLASVAEAPILLVTSGANQDVLNYIQSNLSKDGTIYILGGDLAVSTTIESSLRNFGNVVRLFGQTSYDTNLAILRTADRLSNAKDTDVLVTTGRNFPDAISVSAMGKPILLVNDTINDAQRAFLDEHLDEKSKIYIIGGTAAVSEKAENHLADYKEPIRIAGSNRYTTATKIADTFFEDSKEVSMARGDIFPDAMVGGVLSNAKGIPIILTENDAGFETAFKYVFGSEFIKAVTVFGGPKAISDDAVGMNASGVRRYAFLTIGNKYFFASKDGEIYKDRFFTYDGVKYAANESGDIVINGWHKIGGTTYYFKNFAVSEPPKK